MSCVSGTENTSTVSTSGQAASGRHLEAGERGKQFLFCSRDDLRAAGELDTWHLPEIRYCAFWRFLPSLPACGALAGASCPSQNQPSSSFSSLRFQSEFGATAAWGEALFQRNIQLRIHAEDGSQKRNFGAFEKRQLLSGGPSV